MEPEIRPLDAATAPLLAEAAGEVLDNPVDPVQLAAFLADPRHMMLVALLGGRVVGMASGTELLHPDKPPQMFLNEVGVAEVHRGRGIGRRLVRALLAEARARGCASAWIGTEAENTAANRCYAGAGPKGPPQPFLLYEWELGG
jgi:ribosomal protein S18 acetylase RimI-like enzyme